MSLKGRGRGEHRKRKKENLMCKIYANNFRSEFYWDYRYIAFPNVFFLAFLFI